MSKTRHEHFPRIGAGLLLVPALATGLLGASGAHAAPGTKVHRTWTPNTHAVHAHALVVVPPGNAVVTNCSTAGISGPGGLLTALNSGNVITFACNPATSGAQVGGKYVIQVPTT